MCRRPDVELGCGGASVEEVDTTWVSTSLPERRPRCRRLRREPVIFAEVVSSNSSDEIEGVAATAMTLEGAEVGLSKTGIAEAWLQMWTAAAELGSSRRGRGVAVAALGFDLETQAAASRRRVCTCYRRDPERMLVCTRPTCRRQRSWELGLGRLARPD